MAASLERIYRGASARFDLTITDGAGSVQNINDHPDWAVVFLLAGSGESERTLANGGLTKNPDGTVKILFSPDQTTALAAGKYTPWAKVYDSDGNEWPLISGAPVFDVLNNPIQSL